jgi:hypothetical protein
MASLEAAPFDANGLGLGRVNTRRDGGVEDDHSLAFGRDWAVCLACLPH